MSEHDHILLKGLRVKGFHGVFEHERRAGQDFLIDVALQLDTRPAAGTDQLEDTVDYGALAIGLAEIVRGEPVNLLETLAERLADRCLADQRVVQAEVTVHKPEAPIPEMFSDVAVRIRRGRAVAVDAVLALGSNLGDRLATLQSAVDALRAVVGIEVTAVSPVVETDPVGGPEQPDYLNAVVLVRTTLEPEVLLTRCQRIEAEHGRVRETRWGPRTLDIDLIAVGDRRHSSDRLELPHPRAAERAFVLVPWSDLDPAAWVAGVGSVAELARSAPDLAGVRRRPELVVR